MSKAKSKPRLSVQEFQTWLQGIMEFQNDDWSPNPQQWNAIYDKIMNLKTDETVSTTNISASSIRKIEDVVQEQLRNFRGSSVAAEERYENPSSYRRGNIGTQPAPMQPVSGGSLLEEPEQQEMHGSSPHGVVPGQELISQEEFPQLTPEEIEERIKNARDGVAISDASKTIKTPHVDSTKGYKSGFI